MDGSSVITNSQWIDFTHDSQFTRHKERSENSCILSSAVAVKELSNGWKNNSGEHPCDVSGLPSHVCFRNIFYFHKRALRYVFRTSVAHCCDALWAVDKQEAWSDWGIWENSIESRVIVFTEWKERRWIKWNGGKELHSLEKCEKNKKHKKTTLFLKWVCVFFLTNASLQWPAESASLTPHSLLIKQRLRQSSGLPCCGKWNNMRDSALKLSSWAVTLYCVCQCRLCLDKMGRALRTAGYWGPAAECDSDGHG